MAFTTISLDDKDTRGVFGEYVSVYDIQDAVGDKVTVQIYYESRLAKLDINQAKIAELNQDVDEVIEDEEDIAARENAKSKWAELAKLVGAKPRLDQVTADLVAQFETRTKAIEGKAMIVAMSRIGRAQDRAGRKGDRLQPGGRRDPALVHPSSEHYLGSESESFLFERMFSLHLAMN